jgi:hypothetical protein
MLKRIAKGAKNLASDTAHSLIGDVGRETVHKINNAVGSDRALYNGLPKFTLTDDDVRRYVALEGRTALELKRAQIGYKALSNAVNNRVQTDRLHLQANANIQNAHNVLESAQLDNQLRLQQGKSFIEAQRRDIAALIAADEQAAMMSVLQSYQTVDVQAQQVPQGQQQQQWGDA